MDQERIRLLCCSSEEAYRIGIDLHRGLLVLFGLLHIVVCNAVDDYIDVISDCLLNLIGVCDIQMVDVFTLDVRKNEFMVRQAALLLDFVAKLTVGTNY